MASSASGIFDALDLGIPIPLLYGPVRGIGNIAAQFEKADKTILRAYLLGEGPLNSLLRLWKNRKAVTLPDTTIVRFHPGDDGVIGDGMAATSTGGDQKVDSFFAEFPGATSYVTWSRYAYLFVKFAPDAGAPSADPEILADLEGLKVGIFNSSGVQTGFAYSENPVWWWVDYVIRKFIIPFGKVNQPLTSLELARFDWGLIDAAATHADFDIGGGVKRWSGGGLVLGGNDSNSGMTADQAIEQLHLMCNSYALESNGKLSINPNKSRASVFTFTLDNVLPGSFRVRQPEVRFNQIVPRFRDINLASGSSDHATRFAEATPEPMNHDGHQREAGFTARGMARQRKVLPPLLLDFGNNDAARVWRGARSLVLQELGDEPDPGNAYHLPEEVELDASEDTLAVIPGDVVTVEKGVSEEHGGADYEVRSAVEQPSGARRVMGRKFNSNAFPDVAPPQQAAEAPVVGTGLAPSSGAGNLSYRPLKNVLKATDAGASATIEIEDPDTGSNFVNRIVGYGDMTITAGTKASLSFSTLYFVWYEDFGNPPSGGAKTFNVSTVKEDALGLGKFFMGSILTPADGSPDTIGNNDGGAGDQIGGHVRNRPATETIVGTATGTGQGKNGNWADSADASRAPNITGQTASVTLSGFRPGAEPDRYYRNITLRVKAEASCSNETDVPAANCTAQIRYSTNGGSTWTDIRSQVAPSAALAAQIDTVTAIANGSDLSQLQVRVETLGHASGFNDDGSIIAKMYEAEVEADF